MRISCIMFILRILKDLRRIKSTFACIVCNALEVKHKEVCLKISGKHSMKLRNGSIKFNSYSKQLVVLFKIYADFDFRRYTEK